MDEHLERATTGRSSCKTCSEPIAKGAVRLGLSDGKTMFWHHGICAAIRKSPAFLRGLVESELRDVELDQLKAIAKAVGSEKLKQVIWRHATEPRCLLELPDKYMLATRVGDKSIVVWGPLDEVVASVPDEDLQDVVDTALAAGKTLARDAPQPAKPTGKPRKLSQRFEDKNRETTYAYVITLDEAKLTVTIASEITTGGSPWHPYGKATKKKLDNLEVAQKYFRYRLSLQDSPKVSGDEVALDPEEDFKTVKDKSSDYRYLENAKTEQFFDIDRDASNVIVSEGAIGTRGRETVHETNWDGEAKDLRKQLLAEKTAAGYAEPPGLAGRRAAGNKR